METDKIKGRKKAFLYIVFLYAIIMVLPFFLFEVNSEWYILLEQPLVIFIPTVVISFYYAKKEGVSIKEFFPIKKFSLSTFLWLTVIVFCLPAVVELACWVSYLISPPQEVASDFISPELTMSAFEKIETLIYNLLLLSIFPAICEETLFRGAIWGFSKKLQIKTIFMILMSSLLFGVFHMNFDQLFYTFVLGCILAYVVNITGTLLATMYIHALYNFNTNWGDYFTLPEGISYFSPLSFLSQSIIGIIASILVLCIALRKLKKTYFQKF